MSIRVTTYCCLNIHSFRRSWKLFQILYLQVLYIALPSIIDTNPFLDETEGASNGSAAEKNVHPSVANIPKIFQKILDAANEFQVHPQIVNQLFAYLFFFSNASLFNSLMERGPGGKFYRWTKGVQMRGNLDLVEAWAQSNNLKNQYDEYLAKFQCAVDLLATPKAQLLQVKHSVELEPYNQSLSVCLSVFLSVCRKVSPGSLELYFNFLFFFH